MPTYVYETLPQGNAKKPVRFEIRQSIHEAPLSKHPETGEPVQRIIAGGVGIITHAAPPPRQNCCGGQGGEGCPCACDN
jgi:predicted nucleic acid-binding Zn ribbon protein